MGSGIAPRTQPGAYPLVLGIGFAAGYWIIASAAQAFIFQHGPFLNQLLSRDAVDLSGRLVAVSFLIAMGLMGGRRLTGGLTRRGSLPPPAAAHRWSDSAVRTAQETEERYRTLVENIDIGITLIDKDYNILMTNAAQGKFFHKPVCEFVGRRCYAEFEKRTDVCPHCPGKVAMSSGHPAEVETLGVRDDGTSFPARIRAFPMKGPDGAANGLIEVVQDITGQRQAQELLQRSEERFRSLCQFVPIGIFVTDQAGDCTYVNNCLQKTAGLTLDESLGMQWTRLIHSDDREGMLAAVAQTIQTGSEFSRECRIVTPSGEVKQLAIRAVWLRDAQGARLGQVGAIEDITDRRKVEEALRESEQLFRNLAETIDASICIVQNGLVKYVNPCGCRLLGYSAEELIGKQPWLFVHPDMREAIRSRLLRREQGHPEPTRYELKVQTGDGGEAWLMQSVTSATYEGGTVVLSAAIDITERKLAERALRESELKYRTLVEQLPAVIYTAALDAASTTIYVSPQVERILGYSPETYRANRDLWRQKTHPDDREGVLREVVRCHKEGVPFACEYRMEAADGRTVWLRDEGALVRDQHGHPLFVQGVMLDITDRKRAEEETRKFKTICDCTPHGCAISDVSGRLLYVNAAFAEMHGYTPEELLDKPLSVFHSEEQMPKVNELLDRLMREGQFVNEEVWHTRRDGSVFPTLMDGAVTADASGRPLFFSGMAADISERKQAEAELRRQALLFENITDGIIVTDRQGLIVDWNPGAERIFDYFKHEVLGKSPEMLDRREEASLITEDIHLGIQRDGYWCSEVNFIRKDGTEGVCEAFLVPLRDEAGEWIGTVAVNRDITARKLAERERARLEAQLHRAQRLEAVGTLASGIAHDFNNLLTAIFGYADLARDSLPEEHAARRSLDMIEQAGKQARGVISSLMTFSQKAGPKKAPVDLAGSLAETQQFLRRLLPAVIEIEEDIPADDQLWVNGDAAQLQQVWINLAVNARDAMPGGGRLKVTLRGEDPQLTGSLPGPGASGTPRAVVVIEDTGAGMSAEVCSRAFDPFFTTKPREQGTGLGLAVSHAIVARHEGEIRIESEEGKGTRVSVSLPCCRRPATTIESSRAAAQSAGQGETIMVVEDDEHVRSILVSALRSQGYDVLPAADAQEMLRFIQRRAQDIHLVLLDLDIPQAGGAGILHQTLDALPNAVVLVITAQVDQDLQNAADGRQFLLHKPFTILELSEQVVGLIRQARERRAREKTA